MVNRKTRGLALALLTLILLPAFAAEEKRGRYWYEKPEPAKEEQEQEERQQERPKYTMPSVPSVEELMTWHPRDIGALFEEVHEYHVMAPTLATAREVQKIKAVMNKKARAAAAVEQLAILSEPSLSGVAENAITPTARSIQRRENAAAIDQRLFAERDNFALVLLTQRGCGACDIQRGIIANFVDHYGWPTKEVDILDHPAAAARFGVQVTPTTLLVAKNSGAWQTIEIGAGTLPTLKNNAFQAIRLLNAEISPSQWLTAPIQEGSLYDPAFR